MNPRIAGKLEHLEGHLRSLESVAVACSGGVDSTFLSVAAHRALGERMVAVLGVSPSLARREQEDARAAARRFGFRLETISTGEMENPLYVANAPDRCYHCKSDLFGRLREWAGERGYRWVLDGTNGDDLGDVRPGTRAARELGVRSPLLELGWTKVEIREASRSLGIPIWDKPAAPCLASRIPHGEPVRPELLRSVEAAESALQEAGFAGHRVRAHGDLARIEIPPEMLPRLLDPAVRQGVVRALKSSGFRLVTVDLEGYRPGGGVLEGEHIGAGNRQPGG